MKIIRKWTNRVVKSKVLIANFLIALTTVVEANYDFIKVSHADKYLYITLFTTALNFWLRTITTQSLAEKDKKDV